MAQNEGKKAFLAAVAIGAYLVVMLNDDNTVSPHDGAATKNAIGTTEMPTAALGTCGVVLRNTSGSREVMAKTVFAINEDVFAAAGGKVQALPVGAADYLKIGTAIEAATADGDIVEIIPCDPVVVTVSA